jgi:acyl-CoA hydrolase
MWSRSDLRVKDKGSIHVYQKWVTAEEAVGNIKSGDKVFVGSGAAVPRILVQAMTARHAELEGVQVHHILTMGTTEESAPYLEAGAGVVTSEGDVHYVVTEYGVASLSGKPVGQRAEQLISIAHPDFREELYNYARKSGFTVRKVF